MKTTVHARAASALLLLLTACAGGVRRAEPQPDLDRITREQLVEHRFTSAYEAVAALRSNWLTTRGTDSFRTPSQIQVYFDDVRLGGIESLRGVGINSISYIQHFDGIAATERWGLDHGAGVIFVSTHSAAVHRL
jgi:hypothetical protein